MYHFYEVIYLAFYPADTKFQDHQMGYMDSNRHQSHRECYHHCSYHFPMHTMGGILESTGPRKMFGQIGVTERNVGTRRLAIYLSAGLKIATDTSSAAISLLTDLLCTALPYVILWKVQIKMRLKAVICGLMSFGLAASAANVARNVYVGRIATIDISCEPPYILHK